MRQVLGHVLLRKIFVMTDCQQILMYRVPLTFYNLFVVLLVSFIIIVVFFIHFVTLVLLVEHHAEHLSDI